VFRSSSWQIAETAGLVGEIIFLQGDREEGKRLLADLASEFEKVFGPENERTREARERMRRLKPAINWLLTARRAGY